MDLHSIFGSVAIGKDTSGNFKQSMYGLAVRPASDGKFVARHKGQLTDVTDLVFDGSETLFYRLPTKDLVPGKDVLVRSDNPFSVLFVDEILAGGLVKGTDPGTRKPVTHSSMATNWSPSKRAKTIETHHRCRAEGYQISYPRPIDRSETPKTAMNPPNHDLPCPTLRKILTLSDHRKPTKPIIDH